MSLNLRNGVEVDEVLSAEVTVRLSQVHFRHSRARETPDRLLEVGGERVQPPQVDVAGFQSLSTSIVDGCADGAEG